MKIKSLSLLFLVLISNLLIINVANAACDSSTDSPFAKCGIFYNLFTDLTGLISNSFIALIIAGTIAMFFWALFRGMLRSQGGKEMADNKNTLMWGIGILFVMISVWGIIIFLQDALLPNYKNRTITLPTMPNTAGYGKDETKSTANPSAGGSIGGLLPAGANCGGDSSRCISGICNSKGQCQETGRTGGL